MTTLASTSLAPAERRALDLAVASLQDALGDALLAVWLFGSRARGESPRDDGSDVDLLIVTEAGGRDSKAIDEILGDANQRGGVAPWAPGLRAIVVDPAWIAERRAIEAFLLWEIDRDKVVVYGSGGEEWWPVSSPDHGTATPMSERTRELLTRAHARLTAARRELDGDRGLAVSLAYYAMLYAARAALSEEGGFARSHGGTWHLFHDTFVATGRFDSERARRAAAAERARVDADYEGWLPERDVAKGIVNDAEVFIAQIERLLRR